MEPIILASASPQRRTLLAGLGVQFTVVPSSVDEEGHPEMDPASRAVALATEKAKDIALRHGGAWVIGCDTLVVASDGTRLEKPVDEDDAKRMIRLQSGSMSTVHSGLALLSPTGELRTGLSSSAVHFRPMSDNDVQWWLGTGLWKDRSGSFQIDGLGQLMIERIEGDWSSIVGLPVFLLGELARRMGLQI